MTRIHINNFTIETGHTLEQYKELYQQEYENGELWDFSVKDMTSGAVEPQKDIVYWAIVVDNELRFFETKEKK